jgi:hypothetical protein
MSVLMRARVASFLSGAAVAGAFFMFQLRRDVQDAQHALVEQIERHSSDLESRVKRLEMVMSASVQQEERQNPPGPVDAA